MKKIENLLVTARKHKNEIPISNVDELKQLAVNIKLNQPDSGGLINLNWRLITMAAIGSLIIASGLLWFFSHNNASDNYSLKNRNTPLRINQMQGVESTLDVDNKIVMHTENKPILSSANETAKDVLIMSDEITIHDKIINENNDNYDINGISTLNLTYDEFKKLNVFINKNSVEIITQEIKTQLTESDSEFIKENGGMVKEGNFYLVTYKNTIQNSVSSEEIVSIREFDINNPVYNHVQPVVYTCRFKDGSSTIHSVASPVLLFSDDSLGKKFINDKMIFEDKTKNISRLISQNDIEQINNLAEDMWNLVNTQNSLITNNLIPIRIDPKDVEEAKPVLDLDKFILFLYPNEELLSALPERYRKQIQREISYINKIKNDEIQPEDACKGLKGKQSLLDICRMQSGAITKATIYPNPAKDIVNIKINLSERREISVSLHDVNGGCMLSPILSMKLDAGEKTVNFALPDLENGIYLVAIQSPNGEQVVQKIIISK
ncbi:MAG: T9SS type A sorting domain-containing protein [Ignavibacteriae bacterium]|nr:T9SS type A sorting domain-containing protein [Ignavibacteriota bacterium]